MVSIWHIKGKLRASSYRRKVLLALDQPKTPTDLAKEIKEIKLSHISKTLMELKELKIVVCRNEKAAKGRFYTRNRDGNALIPFVKQIENQK